MTWWARGYKLIRSRQVAQQVVLVFGGLYFGTEDKADGALHRRRGHHGQARPEGAVDQQKVRQAMNKAINREELLKVLYKGRATYTYVAGFYPDLPGWDPTWEKRFPEMYGYDPAAAKRLLAAGRVSQGL